MSTTLKPTFNSGQGSSTTIVERTGDPKWLNQENDSTKWYLTNPNEYTTDFHVNTVNVSDNHWIVYVQYGERLYNWGSGRFFGQEVELLNEEVNSDNSITAKVNVTPLFFKSAKNPVFTQIGTKVNYDLRINNQTVYRRTGGQSNDIFEYGKEDKQTFTFTVPPEKIGRETQFKMLVTYPMGDYPTREIYVGMGFKNPLPKSYKPMGLRKSGTWQTVNKPSGFIKVRKSSWVDKSQENASTILKVDKGKNRIRLDKQFKQLPPMSF